MDFIKHFDVSIKLLSSSTLIFKRQVSFLYLDGPHSPYHPVAETIQNILHNAGVNIRDVETWNTIYHHGFMANPFDDLVERTYKNTRSK